MTQNRLPGGADGTVVVGNRGTPARRVAAAGFVGSLIEWYDFAVYGAMAALVLNELFFPNFAPLVGTLASFSTFAVGFFVRPIGGIIFGHLGDRIGRRNVLVATLLLMGLSTMLIGLLPTYRHIGVWAPVLLVVLRVLQGLGSGAEFGGAVIMAAEHAPARRRGFYASIPTIGVQAGILLASASVLGAALLPDRLFATWGWRLPFIVSALLIAIAMYIRLRISESPLFAGVKQRRERSRVPLLEVLKSHRKSVLIVIGARFEGSSFYVLQVFALTYVTDQLGLDKSTGLLGVMTASVVGLAIIPLAGALSDKIGRRPVYLGGALLLILLAFPFFWLLDTKSTGLILLAFMITIAFTVLPMLAIQGPLFAELFDTHVRFTGFVFARELSSPVSGGIAPAICTALLIWSHGEPWPIAVYMIAMCLVTVVAVYLAPETYRDDLAATRFGAGVSKT